MFARLRHPALVGRDHEQYEGSGTETGEHVGDEALMPGYVDERNALP